MLVYRFGGIPPAKDGQIRNQLALGRDYYNNLVEGENERRLIFLWGGETPPVPPHKPKIKQPKKEGEKPKEIPCGCEECKDFWYVWRGRYRFLSPLNLIPYRNAAREEGLVWGTYTLVERAFSAAWKGRDCFKGLKFRRWQEGGVIGGQIQQGVRPENIFQIEKAFDPRVGRRGGRRHTIKIRVGSDVKRKPIWSDPLPFEMHRPIDGTPVWVQICLKYRGEREEWSVHITCNNVPGRTDEATEGVVAIDVSWRKMPDGLRIAYAQGNYGDIYELKMPPFWQERVERADRIRGHRDDHLNELKARDKTFAIVRKPHRVKAFMAKNEIAMTKELQEWCDREDHLSRYEMGCRRKSTAARRDALRKWGRMLRQKYAIAVLKDSNYKKMKEEAREKKQLAQKPRKQGHHGAPGETTEEICRIFGREENVRLIEAPETTAECPRCGHINTVGAELVITCEQCHHSEDRDYVSTCNLLARYLAGHGKKPTARKQTARFAKRHKKNQQDQQCEDSRL
jgi:Putative transposase DNA-binding domain